MCRGCKIRERVIHRAHLKLDAAVTALSLAHDAVKALAIETAGPTRLSEKSMSFSNKAKAAPPPAPPPIILKTRAKRAARAPTQLALAL